MSAGVSIVDRTGASDVCNRDVILRFHRSERHLHWAIAIPFMVCYVTAAILVVVYNQHPTFPYRAVVSWIHRISGGCLIVMPPIMVARHWRDFRLHLHNVRWAWGWTLADLKWLMLIGPASFSSRVVLPHQGKFNAGEKINFTVLMSTYPVYIVTGLMIALPGIAYTSWLVHVYTAALVATPLMLGHIFMALVNPDTRVGLSGMLTGFVDRHWAAHHYRLWYDKVHGKPVEVTADAAGVEAPPRHDTIIVRPLPPVPVFEEPQLPVGSVLGLAAAKTEPGTVSLVRVRNRVVLARLATASRETVPGPFSAPVAEGDGGQKRGAYAVLGLVAPGSQG